MRERERDGEGLGRGRNEENTYAYLYSPAVDGPIKVGVFNSLGVLTGNLKTRGARMRIM